MNEYKDAMDRVELAASRACVVAEGTDRLFEDMQEEWCIDARYYAFRGLLHYVRDLTAEVADAAEELRGMLDGGRAEMGASDSSAGEE